MNKEEGREKVVSERVNSKCVLNASLRKLNKEHHDYVKRAETLINGESKL